MSDHRIFVVFYAVDRLNYVQEYVHLRRPIAALHSVVLVFVPARKLHGEMVFFSYLHKEYLYLLPYMIVIRRYPSLFNNVS